MPGNQQTSVMQCMGCGSTFSRQQPWYDKLAGHESCQVCGSGNLRAVSAEGPHGPVEITCQTCSHTWPITNPHSMEVCPSCGGNPLIKGQLVEDPQAMTMVWKPPVVPPEVEKLVDEIVKQTNSYTGIGPVSNLGQLGNNSWKLGDGQLAKAAYEQQPYSQLGGLNGHSPGLLGSVVTSSTANPVRPGLVPIYSQQQQASLLEAQWQYQLQYEYRKDAALLDGISKASPAPKVDPKPEPPLLEFGGPRKIVVPR